MHTSSKVGAAVAAILLTGAGCSVPGLPGGSSSSPSVTTASVAKTSTASNGGTCGVNLQIPHINTGKEANDEMINSLIDVNALVMLDGSVDQTLEQAADSWLASCISEITLPYESNSLTMTHEVGINEGGLFSIGITGSRQYEDTGLIAAFGDLYNTKTGEEYELAELVNDGAMPEIYKLVFAGLVAQHRSALDPDSIASLEAVAKSGDIAVAEELLSTGNIDFIVKNDGIVFPFASEAFVPLESGRLDVLVPWASIDGLLKKGTALADWRAE